VHSTQPSAAALIPLFSDYLTNRSHTGTMNKNSPWLFPSNLAGQHINPNTLQKRLKIFGIHTLSARNATLADLALELDPTSLAALLGYSAKVMTKHAARAGTTMASYPSLITEPAQPIAEARLPHRCN
jgi:hypothetical protein